MNRLDELCLLARRAGAAIMEIYESDFKVETKADDSPVTLADENAEKIILEGLAKIAPDIPAISEEAAAAGKFADISGGKFWLVDPLDGTRAFVGREGEFTVNIGLIDKGVPVLGVIYAPTVDTLYAAADGAAFREKSGRREKIRVRPVPAEGLTVVASKRHGDPEQLAKFLAGKKVAELAKASSSLKLCLVAAGEADLYPRFGPTSEWDTAAGDAILRIAGGRVTDLAGAPLAYGKKGFRNEAFIAWGGC